ncbi:adenosylcobinamide-GDP ribazoletransferase [Deinococcus alpinitundrae]|uniref:adenosylcobinamide-GDP ribazoletransferase n=1 Tax=Deinococcus alpinitundrae TaxID=468913 RepID=UPI001ED8C5AC|nr:adenosylcobinamide-GDP ribazoletransferase [Deinococcus alpinitundrae]
MLSRDLGRAAHLALTSLTTLPLPHIGEVREGGFTRASGFYPLAGHAVGGVVARVGLLGHWLHLPSDMGAALGVDTWLAVTGMGCCIPTVW